MSRKKLAAYARDNAVLLKLASGNSQIPAEQLLDEIDNLALLLHEVRKQTDRIEAAADAIGDAILNRLDTGRVGSMPGSRAASRMIPIQPKTPARLRTMPPRTAEINDVQP